MNNRNHPAAALKHGIGVAAVVVLSIPGALTALSPIVMTWAPTSAHRATSSAIAATARSAPGTGAN